MNILQVHCQLPDGVATYGEEYEVNVNNCSDPHCFQFEIPYPASDLEQIKNLIHRSSHCVQRIEINCLSAPLMVIFHIFSLHTAAGSLKNNCLLCCL